MVPFSAWMIRLRSMAPGGDSGPGPAGRVAAGLSPGPFGPGRHREPPYPNPLAPTPLPAATCCATLTPRPLSSLLRPPLPQLSLHSPFTTAGGRWENRKWRLLYDRLFPWGVLRRPALLGGRHDAVRKMLYACQ